MYGGAGRWLGAQGARSAQAGRWALGHTGAGALGAQGKLALGALALGRHADERAQRAGRRQGAAVRSRGSALGALGPFSIRFDSFFS